MSKMEMQREEVERGLNRLVEVAKRQIPLLSEIRVFGSYVNGNWNPEMSDVDVMVETGDEDLSRSKWYTYYRRFISSRFINEMTQGSCSRIDALLFSKGDLMVCWNENGGKGPIGKNMKSGRLLYPTNLPAVVPQVNVGVQI